MRDSRRDGCDVSAAIYACTLARSYQSFVNKVKRASSLHILHRSLKMLTRKNSLDSNNNILLVKWCFFGETEMKGQLESRLTSSKRRVQFADVMGQALVSVKIISPASSEEDVFNTTNRQLSLAKLAVDPRQGKRLKCCFPQPAARDSAFEKRVTEQNVCLENIVFSTFAIAGTVKVRNLAFAKDVRVRYTLNEWRTYQDIWADYVPDSSNGKTDRFQFRFTVPQDFRIADGIEFAIRYRVAGKEFWDNNSRRNYRIECCSNR